MTVLSRVACLLAAGVAAANVVLDPLGGRTGNLKLMLLVPGGKVPPEDYKPMASATQEKSSLKLAVAILQCHINLCDAFEISGPLEALVDQVNKSHSGALRSRADVFVSGHSLGGTDVRHFYDTWPGSAGLALFGTQYNGDHEDFKGPLGYPSDLKAFPGPLLALTGELDMLPTSHTAVLVDQWQELNKEGGFSFKKLPVIVPGMDHSQFCPPFHVSSDLMPEIDDSTATDKISSALGAWLDAVTSDGADDAAVAVLKGYTDDTVHLAAPFIKAQALDGHWCADAQKSLGGAPQGLEVVTATTTASSAVEHCHPSTDKSGPKATVCSFVFMSYNNSLLPQYFPDVSAKDITCKMISEDKLVFDFGGAAVDMSSDSVQNACMLQNKRAVEKAKELLRQDWPRAVDRFTQQGKDLVFLPDTAVLANIGPLFVFKSALKLEESAEKVTIGSPKLISPIVNPSLLFPGSHYCKLLAPSKAVELIMTLGLTKRYSSAAVELMV